MSVRIPITLACGDYDRTRALRTGEITPDGVALMLRGLRAAAGRVSSVWGPRVCRPVGESVRTIAPSRW